MNLHSVPSIRDNPGFAIRDRDWSINGPIIGPTPRSYDREPAKRTPLDRRDSDMGWPPEDRRTPRVPDSDPFEEDLPYIVPQQQPATCWLI